MMQPTPERTQSLKPRLRFTPYAWAKLLFMCHSRPTEVSGMGISSARDVMTIEDIMIVKQRSNAAFTSFDAEDYANKMVDLCDPEGKHKLAPARCQRIWIHTHPEGVGRPSMTDVDTFAEAFGLPDWAIMFIYSKSEDVYCQLRMTSRNANGHATELKQEIPVSIAWDTPFPAADPAAWTVEMDALVTAYTAPTVYTPLSAVGVMPHVRTGVIQPPAAPVARESWRNGERVQNTHIPPVRREPKAAGKMRLMPVAGSLLAGLSSQQLTRLLCSDISAESLVTGGILPKLQKSGWELATQAIAPEPNIATQKSTVYFTNKALPGACFGNRDMALADRQVLIHDKEVGIIAELGVAEFDLQATAEDRIIGDAAQYDCYGYPLDVAYPWHVPGRQLLFVSLNELEELLFTLDAKAQRPQRGMSREPQQTIQLDKANSTLMAAILAYIEGSWIKLQAQRVEPMDAVAEIMEGLVVLHPEVGASDVRPIIRELVEDHVHGGPPPTKDDGEETQVILFEQPSDNSGEDPDMEKAKVIFREILVRAQAEGQTVVDINQQFAMLYDKALKGRWIDPFILLLAYVREHGFAPSCLDQPITLTPKTLQLLDGDV